MEDKKEQEINRFEKTIEEMFSEILTEIRKSRDRLVFDAVGGKKLVLAPEDIYYFERIGRVTFIETVWGRYEVWEKLDKIEKMLLGDEFVRCHNSYIVNLPAVLEVQKNIIRMRNGDNITISRSYTGKMRESFERWGKTPK